MTRSVAVVGGGITGLTLAHDLQVRGCAVTVFDGAPQLGGLSAACAHGDFVWDRFYHVIAPGDRHLLALLTDLGLGEAVRWTPTRQGLWLDGAVRSLDSAWDLLRLPGLSLWDKFRVGALTLHARKNHGADVLDHTSAADWLRRHCGDRAWDRLWRHLLRAKLGSAAGQVSARFIIATLRRLLTARRRTGGGERFGYVEGGYAAVLERLCQRLRDGGAGLCPATPVARVRVDRDGHGVTVTAAGRDQPFDQAVLTLPNPALAEVTADLPEHTAAALRGTPYLGVACTVAVGAGRLGPHYILNLCDDALRITGVIETSNVVDPGQTAGHTLVYLPRYGLHGSRDLAADDAEVRQTALQDLAAVHPRADAEWLRHAAVHRAAFIQPLPLTGRGPVQPPRSIVPGRVFAVNNAQLPACILNNNDCVGLARLAAAAIAAGTPGGTPAPPPAPVRA